MKRIIQDNTGHISFALVFILLAIVIGAVYANSVRSPFYFDDYLFLADNPEIAKLSNLRHIFNQEKYFAITGERTFRPVPFTVYILLQQVFHNSPGYWRIFNLLLHLATSSLLFLVLRRFHLDDWLCLLAAVLFASHTIHTVLINMITTNSEMMGAFLCLLAFHWYFKKGALWRIASLTMYLLSYFAKETYIVLPALCLVFTWYEERERFSIKKFILNQSGYLVIAGLGLLTSFVIMKNPLATPNTYPGGSIFTALMTFSVALIYYFKIFFVPTGLTPIYNFPVFTSLFDWQVFTSLIILTVIGGIIIYGFNKKQAYAPFLAWFFIFLLPTSNIIPSGWIVNEWYLYFPLMGLIPGLLLLCQSILKSFNLNPVKPVLTIGILFFIFLSFLTVRRNTVWQDPRTLWQDVLSKTPDNMKAMTSLGNALLQMEKNSEALEVYLKVVKKYPQYPANYLNVGCAYDVLGQKKNAINFYAATILLDKTVLQAYTNLGRLFIKSGEKQKAKDILRKGLQVYPNHPQLTNYLNLVNSN